MNNELVPDKVKKSRKYVKFFYTLLNTENLNKVLSEEKKFTIIDIDYTYVSIRNYSNMNKYSNCLVRK